MCGFTQLFFVQKRFFILSISTPTRLVLPNHFYTIWNHRVSGVGGAILCAVLRSFFLSKMVFLFISISTPARLILANHFYTIGNARVSGVGVIIETNTMRSFTQLFLVQNEFLFLSISTPARLTLPNHFYTMWKWQQGWGRRQKRKISHRMTKFDRQKGPKRPKKAQTNPAFSPPQELFKKRVWVGGGERRGRFSLKVLEHGVEKIWIFFKGLLSLCVVDMYCLMW